MSLLALRKHFLDFFASQTVPFDTDMPVVAVAVVLLVPDNDNVIQGRPPRTTDSMVRYR